MNFDMKKKYLLAIFCVLFCSALPIYAQVTDLIHAKDSLRETEQRLQQSHDATLAMIDVLKVQLSAMEMRVSAIDTRLSNVRISIVETDDAIRAIK